MLTAIFNIRSARTEPGMNTPSTIYVDDDNTAGPWNGTPAYPYQNLTSALEHSANGTSIFAFAGTYNEDLALDANYHLTEIAITGQSNTNTTLNGQVYVQHTRDPSS